ncbi:MAG TPA: capsule assembly Wzi family protein [Terriglobales bacterium]|nr:capsule assembly Wzi family protein [Terriglobales bacterium]
MNGGPRCVELVLVLSFLLSGAPAASAQQDASSSSPTQQAEEGTSPPAKTVSHPNESEFFIHLAEDQKAIWTSPFHLKARDAKWLVPMGGIATGLFVTDPQSSYAMRLNNLDAWKLGSDVGVAAAGGMTAASYVWGRLAHNDRARETGVLATEAMINAFGVDYALKGITGREAPIPSNFQNIFFHGGLSFPSDHAAVTWAFASVVAQEYPHPVTEFGAYGLALGVSIARAAADQHFLSDVFIGGLLGYQIGRHVYKVRHNPEIDDDLKIVAEETSAPRPTNFASVHVPLDSWIYPAMERLIGQAYIDTAFLGIRPWTRMSCANMLIQMNSRVEFHTDVPPEIWELKKTLDEEFAPEIATWEGHPTESLQLDSVYTRVTSISGAPVNDSYHFGQTLINDYGRPYWQGWNNISGFSASANDGRFAFYVDGEYQYSPTIPGYPLSVRQVIANVDENPLQPPEPVRANQFRLLDTYAMMKYGGMDISVGKQSMWWGPGESGALLMSNNAAPFWMIQVNRQEPTNIPGLSKFLGPFEFANFFGALAGHQFPPGAYFFGQKVSFKPTENLEFGFTRDDVWGGQGHVPITLGAFWNSFTSFTDVSPAVKFSRNDPGARHASFDFSYRLPFVRRWLTLYTDSLVHDDVNPVSAPRRSAINPGIYLTHFPGLPKLDFRAEAVYTDPPTVASMGGHFIYWEVVYHDAYLNDRYLMGNWIGREGKGYQAWSTYHLSPKSSIQVAVRNSKIADDFIPGGSTQWDWNASATLWFHKNLEIQPFLQYETWWVPVLAPTRQHDFATSIQITWWPSTIGARRASQ